MERIKTYIISVAKRFYGFSIGMRTMKTALSVFLCLLLYHALGVWGVATGVDAFLACVAAIVSMQDTIANSIQRGFSRLEGTFIGAVFGMIYLYAIGAIPYELAHIAALAAGVILLIGICNILGHNDAIVMGCVVFLVITLQQTTGSPLEASVYRLLDTAAGIGISIAVNHFIRSPDKQDDEGDDPPDG